MLRLYQRYLIGLGTLYEDIANGSEAHASTLSSNLTILAGEIQGDAESLEPHGQNGEAKRSLLTTSESSENVQEQAAAKASLASKETKEEAGATSKPSQVIKFRRAWLPRWLTDV